MAGEFASNHANHFGLTMPFFGSKYAIREEKKGQKKCDQIEDKLAELETRKEEYPDLERKVKESRDGQLSTTDPDSRAVIYHRNVVQVGYNLPVLQAGIQATVDADQIFVVDVYVGGE